jgi:hypothetical protein
MFTKGYIRVAKCCIATGDIASARQALETAGRLEPNNSAVAQENNSLAVLQKHQHDAQSAFTAGDYRKVRTAEKTPLRTPGAWADIHITTYELLTIIWALLGGLFNKTSYVNLTIV